MHNIYVAPEITLRTETWPHRWLWVKTISHIKNAHAKACPGTMTYSFGLLLRLKATISNIPDPVPEGMRYAAASWFCFSYVYCIPWLRPCLWDLGQYVGNWHLVIILYTAWKICHARHCVFPLKWSADWDLNDMWHHLTYSPEVPNEASWIDKREKGIIKYCGLDNLLNWDH